MCRFLPNEIYVTKHDLIFDLNHAYIAPFDIKINSNNARIVMLHELLKGFARFFASKALIADKACHHQFPGWFAQIGMTAIIFKIIKLTWTAKAS